MYIIQCLRHHLWEVVISLWYSQSFSLSLLHINRCLGNATSRINTAFFVTEIKNLLTACDIMELFRNHKPRPKRRHIYDTTKQLTLADIYEDCQKFYESDKPPFLTLLKNQQVQFDSLLKYYGFRLEQTQPYYYSIFSTEYVYNGELPEKSLFSISLK